MEPTKSSLNSKFPNNSDKARESQIKDPQPAPQQEAQQEPMSPFMAAFTWLFNGTPTEIRKRFVEKSLKPYLKDFLFKTGVGFWDIAVNHGAGYQSGPIEKNSLTSGSGNYQQYGKKNNPRLISAGSYDFSVIVFDTRGEAESKLRGMIAYLSDYPSMPVRVYLDNTAQVESTWIDEDWGWRSLDGAEVKMNMNGKYYIDLPKPVYLR